MPISSGDCARPQQQWTLRSFPQIFAPPVLFLHSALDLRSEKIQRVPLHLPMVMHPPANPTRLSLRRWEFKRTVWTGSTISSQKPWISSFHLAFSPNPDEPRWPRWRSWWSQDDKAWVWRNGPRWKRCGAPARVGVFSIQRILERSLARSMAMEFECGAEAQVVN